MEPVLLAEIVYRCLRRGHAADARDVYVLFTVGMEPRICGK